MNPGAGPAKTEQRITFCGKIILAASEGKENIAIARDLATTVSTVGKWRRRFIESRVNGLSDASRLTGRATPVSMASDY